MEKDSYSLYIECLLDGGRGTSTGNCSLFLQYEDNKWFSSEIVLVFTDGSPAIISTINTTVLEKNGNGKFFEKKKKKRPLVLFRSLRKEDNSHVLMVQNVSGFANKNSAFTMNVFSELPYVTVDSIPLTTVSVQLNVPNQMTKTAVSCQEGWSIVGTLDSKTHLTITVRPQAMKAFVSFNTSTIRTDVYNSVRIDADHHAVVCGSHARNYKSSDLQLRNRHLKHHQNELMTSSHNQVRVEYGLCDPYNVMGEIAYDSSETHFHNFFQVSTALDNINGIKSFCSQHFDGDYYRAVSSAIDSYEQKNRVVLYVECQLHDPYYAFCATLTAHSKSYVGKTQLIDYADKWLSNAVNLDSIIGLQVSDGGCEWIPVKDLIVLLFSEYFAGSNDVKDCPNVVERIQFEDVNIIPNGSCNVNLLILRCAAWAAMWEKVFKIVDMSESKVKNTALHPMKARFNVNPQFLRDAHFTIFRYGLSEWFGECGMETFLKRSSFL